MNQKRKVARREPALLALAREAVIKVNQGKHGPLFGEVSVSAGAEIVRLFFVELISRAKKGEKVRLAGVGVFEVRTHAGNPKRPEGWKTLAFSAAGCHRGLPKLPPKGRVLAALEGRR